MVRRPHLHLQLLSCGPDEGFTGELRKGFPLFLRFGHDACHAARKRAGSPRASASPCRRHGKAPRPPAQEGRRAFRPPPAARAASSRRTGAFPEPSGFPEKEKQNFFQDLAKIFSKPGRFFFACKIKTMDSPCYKILCQDFPCVSDLLRAGKRLDVPPCEVYAPSSLCDRLHLGVSVRRGARFWR